MKRFWVVVGLVVVVFAAPAAASEIGAGIGFWDTEGADSDNGFMVKFSLDVGEKWNIDLRGSFFDGHAFAQAVRTLDIEATAIDVGLSYDFNPSSRANPYVGAGVNYSLFKSTAFNTVLSESEQSRVDDEPGWYVLGGVKGPISGSLGYFVEVMYRQNKANVEGDGLAAFDAIEVDFAGAGASAGISFNW